MQFILAPACTSLTGALIKQCGYSIQRRKKGFFSRRNSRGTVHYYDHWDFIVNSAQMAQSKFYITDIVLSRKEFFDAIREAKLKVPEDRVQIDPLYACDVLNLKKYYNL